MQQKLKVSSYTSICFLALVFSFTALLVPTGVAEAAEGDCIPVERIRGQSQEDLKLWIERCEISGQNGTCGISAEWPDGDAGRCEVQACTPGERIKGHALEDYELWVKRCKISGEKGTCGNSAEWPDGDAGRCE